MSNKITKQELVEKLFANSDDVTSKTASARIVNQIIDEIGGALKKGNDVTITGFGTFKTSSRKASSGTAPNGDTWSKPPYKTVTFKPGAVLKDKVNG